MSREDSEPMPDAENIREVPLLVYKTGLSPFNDWDDREFPEDLQRVVEMGKMSLGYFEEANRLEGFLRASAEHMGVVMPDARTMIARNSIEEVWKSFGISYRRLVALRRRMVTVLKHIEEGPLLKAAEGSSELMTLIGYYGEVYSIVVEQKLVRHRLEVTATTFMMCLVEGEDDTELSDKLEEFRIETFVDISRKMRNTRRKEKYV